LNLNCGRIASRLWRLFPLIDSVVLLSAPVTTIIKRLQERSFGGYGHTEEERQKISELITTIEPLLRRSANHEIDTSGSVQTTVDEILGVC